jgi:hypothetical protein
VSQCKLLSKYELKGKYKGTAFKNCDWTAGWNIAWQKCMRVWRVGMDISQQTLNRIYWNE